MNFTIVIPTFKRIEKLDRCIESILQQTHQDFYIYVLADNFDFATTNHVNDRYNSKFVTAYTMQDHCYVMGCWNWFTLNHFDEIQDAMVWIVDDVQLYPDCLDKLNQAWEEHFGESRDGVLGIHQVCPGNPNYTYKPYGQVALGKTFISRYPNNMVCCPNYTHFYQDEEMWEFAKSLGKFHETTATLNHYHPAFIKDEMDETHSIPRGETHSKDTDMHRRRQINKLIWGKSFQLLGGKRP